MDLRFSTHQHRKHINAIGHSPTGDQLAVGDHGGGVTIYQPTTFTEIRRLELGGRVRALAYSPDGKYLAAGGNDEKVSIFHTSDFRIVREISFGGWVRAICFGADSTYMAVAGMDKKVSIFDTDFNIVKEVQQETYVDTLSYSQNSKSLLIGLYNSTTIAELDATNYTMLRQTNVDHSVLTISHSHTGKYIAVGSFNKTMIYKADNLESIRVYDIGGRNRTAFHPDGTLTITSGNGNTIGHFDTSEWNDDISPGGFTALMKASAKGNTEAIKDLQDNGAKIDEKNDKDSGKTAVMYASENIHSEYSTPPLHAAPVNSEGPGGLTALMEASVEGNIEALKYLLDNGADIDEKNDEDSGKTAIMYASEYEHSEALKILFQHQALVDCTDSKLALDEDIQYFLSKYEFAKESKILSFQDDFHQSPDEFVSRFTSPLKILKPVNVLNILLAVASSYNQTEAAKLFLDIIEHMEPHDAVTQVMHNIPKYLMYIGQTFLQDHCASSPNDLTVIIRSLSTTEKGGKDVLHEMVKDSSMAQNLKILVTEDFRIADVQKDGKKVFYLACSECMEAMKEGRRLLQEFNIVDGPLLHKSDTACVIKVNRFDEKDSNAGNTNEEPIPIALKCMYDIEPVKAEIDGHKKLPRSRYIIALTAIYYDKSVPMEEVTRLKGVEDDSIGDELYLQEKESLEKEISSFISKKTENETTNEENALQGTTKNDKTYKFVLVFNYADRGLDAALRHDRISDPDRRYLAKQILQDIGKAISALHHHGRIHGDIKPLNIMREGSTWKLIDLDVSCPIGEKYGTKLPSSGCCPPEVAKILFKTKNLQSLEASVAHDLWSFGTIIFHVLTGESFWKNDEEGNLVEEQWQALLQFEYWDLKERVENKYAINREAKTLLMKLLHPDPAKRLEAFKEKEDDGEEDQEGKMIISNVLEDDFFSGRSTLEKIDKNVIKLISISKGQSKELKKMGEVLLNAIYEATEVKCPTTFIILNKKLPEPPTNEDKEKWKQVIELQDDGTAFKIKWNSSLKQATDWISDLTTMKNSIEERDTETFFDAVRSRFKSLMNKEKMYFYYVDELTGEPVRGGKDYPNYPFPIVKPSEFVSKMLPLIENGMKAMSLYNGVAGVCQMFGYPFPTVPKDIQENMNNSVKKLKLKSSVQMFKAVQEQVEDGNEKQSNSVRGACLRSLEEFIKSVGDNSFAGLGRIKNPNDGHAIWTLEKDEEKIKEILEKRASMREKEEILQNKSLLEDLESLESLTGTAQEDQAETAQEDLVETGQGDQAAEDENLRNKLRFELNKLRFELEACMS